MLLGRISLWPSAQITAIRLFTCEFKQFEMRGSAFIIWPCALKQKDSSEVRCVLLEDRDSGELWAVINSLCAFWVLPLFPFKRSAQFLAVQFSFYSAVAEVWNLISNKLFMHITLSTMYDSSCVVCVHSVYLKTPLIGWSRPRASGTRLIQSAVSLQPEQVRWCSNFIS